MIEPLLFFVLGLLVAALLWLLLLPAFWRRATRLARQALEQSLPLTPNEIAAERDRLRARFAVEAALAARREEKARADVLAARAETGECLRAEAELRLEQAARAQLLAERETEREILQARLAALEAERDEVQQAYALAQTTIAGLELQRDTLAARLHAAVDLAEERRLHLEERGCEAENLRAALADEARRSAELRLELQSKDIALRAAERAAESLENEAALARIKRGELPGEDSTPARDGNLRAGRA